MYSSVVCKTRTSSKGVKSWYVSNAFQVKVPQQQLELSSDIHRKYLTYSLSLCKP